MSSSSGGDAGFHSTPGEGQQVALTEDEQKLVAKLLGDPTYFPIEFRRWLKDYIENSNIQISASQIIGGGAGSGAGDPVELPAGIILAYGGTVFGKDCVPCNGNSLSRTDYADLFAVIGTNFGSNASDTFRVPDLRDRSLFGVGSSVSMGQNEGASLGTRGPKHFHNFNKSFNTSSDGNHSHPYVAARVIYMDLGGNLGQLAATQDQSMGTGNAGNHNHSVAVSGPTSGGGAQDAPGYMGIQFVITTGRTP